MLIWESVWICTWEGSTPILSTVGNSKRSPVVCSKTFTIRNTKKTIRKFTKTTSTRNFRRKVYQNEAWAVESRRRREACSPHEADSITATDSYSKGLFLNLCKNNDELSTDPDCKPRYEDWGYYLNGAWKDRHFDWRN